MIDIDRDTSYDRPRTRFFRTAASVTNYAIALTCVGGALMAVGVEVLILSGLWWLVCWLIKDASRW